MIVRRLIAAITAITLTWLPAVAFAQAEIDLSVDTSVTCDLAAFQATAAGGLAPFTLDWNFGDMESLTQDQVSEFPVEVQHGYPAQGEYSWSLAATDAEGQTAEAGGIVTIDGPVVTLTSDPFPPLLLLLDGQASVELSAEVAGGIEPYEYAWEISGGEPQPGGDAGQASFTFSEAGKYLATVTVTDGCGLSGQDTLLIVVVDPDEEDCHPMAQRIADAVNTLFPDQAESLYTCADIYDIFSGGLTGSQIGFGRMWHAYHLSLTMEELTWEEIRDWHLEGNGWGGLVQLDRFAGALDEIGLRELFDMVISGDASIQQIRHSLHAVLRYEADFEDALARLAVGMSPGELGRFYRTAQELGLDGTQLDQYLADGFSLQELSHAARVADRTGADWGEVAEAHAGGYSWGAIRQAQRLADDGDWMGVLEAGIGEVRQQQRDQARDERQQDRDQRTAARLAKQFGVSEAEVWSLFNGSCTQDWKCVRGALREAHRPAGGPKPKD